MNVSIDRLAGSAYAEAEAPLHAPALPGFVTEEERTLLGIRQARDLVLGKNRELIDKLARAEDEIAELTFQRDDHLVARDVALRKVSILEAEVAGLRTQIALLSEQHAALGEAEKIYVLARAEIEADLLTLAQERDDAVAANRAGAIELASLRAELEARQATAAQTEPAAAKAEAVLQELAAAREEHELCSAQQKTHIATLSEQLATARRAAAESQREAERLQAEGEAARLRNAEEKAALEMRVVALEASLAARPTPTPVDAARPTAPEAGARPVPAGGPPPPRQPVPGPAPLSDQDLRDTIGALIAEFEAFKEQPDRPEPLTAFEASLLDLAERTRASGLDLIHFITSVGSDFIRRLRATPARIPASLPILELSVEMLGWLGLRGRAEMLDASGALVYAVDDDVDNCECLATAFEKVALQTKYSVRPDVALAQIAAHPCELIILDVDLPGMDGFQLHAHLRKLPAHATTPIIFLSGHLSTIERLAALGEDNNEFVAKPYNLSELTLRVLTRIVEARLG